MDNAVFFVIMAAEAGVIVWLSSQLRQYRKLARLLDETPPPGAAAANTTVTSDSSPSASRAKPLSASISGEPEPVIAADIEDAKRAQGVMARCHYAEFYVEQLDDDHEREQFRGIVQSCMDIAADINDSFYRSSALEPLALILDRAGWQQMRDAVLGDIEEPIVRDRVTEKLSAEA